MGERVTNGSFNSGLTGWTKATHNGGGYAAVNTGLWDPGVYYCYISGWGDGAWSKISQSVDLTNVDSLTFDAWASFSNGSSSGVGPGVYLDGAFIGSLSESDDLMPYEIDVSGYSGNHTIEFAVYNDEEGAVLGVTHISAIGQDVPPAPIAAFTGYPASGVAPLEVLFTDESSNNPTEWLWDFGDGRLSAVQNPRHTYVNPGTYTVDLKATNAGGLGTLTKTDYITVTAPPVTGVMKWQLQIGPL